MKDKQTVYRKATFKDTQSIINLVHSAYRGESSRAGWTTEADLLDGGRTYVEEVEAAIESDSSVILLVELDGMLIASVHIRVCDDEAQHAYLGMFAVAPHLQNKGIGKNLLLHAERYAREQWCCVEIEIAVIRQRTELIEWYERRGYVKTGETKDFPSEDERYGIPKGQKLILFVYRKTI